jgi:hypothetical protein
MGQPRLTFFCELETEELQRFFADSAIIDDLLALRACVSLAIHDFSAERAAVVRRLNEAGIPIVAWQLLPMEHGYWFNLDNAPQAVAHYIEFRSWTANYNLQWVGVGVDIEPDIRDFEHLQSNRWNFMPVILRRALDNERLRRAQALYGALVTQMRLDGYRVDSYQLPAIVDERRTGSTLLQRIGGLIDIPADREVLMLYTSAVPPSLLWSYAPDAQSIGVGSTGGGVKIKGAGELPALDWDAFSRDLLLARHWNDDIVIFSLEGCVLQDFMERLKTFDWDQPIAPPPERMVRLLEGARKAMRVGLWASAHPSIVLGGLIVLFWLGSGRRSGKK